MKSDKIEVYNRIRIVQEWILKGEITSDIVRNCSVQWGIGKRQSEKYVKKAFELFQEQMNQNQTERIAFHVQARMKLYKKALEQNAYRVCRELLTDMAKLEGFYIKNGKIIDKLPNDSKHNDAQKAQENA